jgi:hypothetical protein
VLGFLTDPLRDSIWQFIGAIVGTIAVIVAAVFGYLTYRVTRRRKALTYEVLSISSLARLHEDVRGHIRLLFDDQEVSDVKLALVRVTNSGNQPIISPDFERPLKFTIDQSNESARILTAGVSKTVPDNLGAEVVSTQSEVILAPLLLNTGDSVTINILTTLFDGDISVDGRIIGVKSIERGQKKVPWIFSLNILGGTLAILSIVTTTSFFLSSRTGTVQAPPQSSFQKAIDYAYEKPEIEHVIRESQVYETTFVLANPTFFDPRELDRYWVPTEQGGLAVRKVEEAVRELSKRSIRFGKDTHPEVFEITSINISDTGDYAEATAHERWFVRLYREGVGPLNVENFSPQRSALNGTYQLRKMGGRWLILNDPNGTVQALLGEQDDSP